MVFIAVRRSCALHWPSKLLLLSLIVTDVGTGAITQPVFTALLLAKASNMPHRTCVLLRMCYYVFSLFSSASLIMMAAISFDRYAALFHHLKYREIVTAKTVGVFLAASWATSAFYASALGWNKTLHVYVTLCGISSLLFLTAGAKPWNLSFSRDRTTKLSVTFSTSAFIVEIQSKTGGNQPFWDELCATR